MRPSHLVLVLAIGVLAACRSRQAPATGTAPPIDREKCDALASLRHANCGSNRQDVFDQCMAYARLGEAAACVPQTLRSFDCGLRALAGCERAECCEHNIHQCDDIDVAFDHCVRGYCGGHPANPDCRWLPANKGATPAAGSSTTS